MRQRLLLAALGAWAVSQPLSAQSRSERLAHFRAFAESTVTSQDSWSGTGAIVGGVSGGLVFGAAFYHFTHRDGAVNSTESDLGGALIGAAFGAATGALAGAFIGSLFPKHGNASP